MAKQTAPTGLVQAIETFHGPGTLLVTEGSIWAATDPVVTPRPHLFRAVALPDGPAQPSAT